MIETLLNAQEKEVIRKLFFEDKNLVEIGKEIGLSPTPISTIKEVALRKLRHSKSLKYTERVELNSRDKTTYEDRLSSIVNIIYTSKVEENEKIKNILYKIDAFTWIKRGRLRKLNSSVFNEICDEIKAIVSKEKYNDKDILALNRIVKRLEQEVDKANQNLEARPPS